MALCPLIVLLLVASCYCAPLPGTYGGGFVVGHESNTNWALGGEGKISRDHFSFTADAEGEAGAERVGRTYGKIYGDLNGKKFGAEGELSSDLGLSIKPSFHGQGGIDSKGRLPFAFKPSLSLPKRGEIGGFGRINTGDDAEKYFKSPSRKSTSSNEWSVQ